MDASSLALLELGRALARADYQFVTPSPETHRRVVARRARARDVRDVFGWSLPFEPGLMPAELAASLERAEACERDGALLRSRVRFSTLQGGLYVHSAYPTVQGDAVFFGPDTYRFCAFIARVAPPARYVVDIGCGSGAGGLVAARAAGAARLALADINARALACAGVNAQLAGRDAELVVSDVLGGVSGTPDLIVANPPYMRDAGTRLYRDGGGELGEGLSLRIAREGLVRLAPGGTLLLYTGAAIVDGRDALGDALRELVRDHTSSYEELDPDVFGEQLDQPGYEHVERIAAVALTVRKAA